MVGEVAVRPIIRKPEPQSDEGAKIVERVDAQYGKEKDRPWVSAYDKLSDPSLPQSDADRIFKASDDKPTRDKVLLNQNPSTTVVENEIESGKDQDTIRDAKRFMSSRNFARLMEQLMRKEPL